ncbi:flagellar assembly protein FliW [Butyrivibrio sp. AE3004]|uniref:flagellar assembly protein FliW n=1 Tax=Butyrivibrio sp. AE3004 TaxID=1506994 RepID=UPI0004946534|nr:flagellar assembly protein FliW [Butyrivibrio sp. AE3004]
MKLITRIFGEIEIEDSKIIEFPKGIIGFPDMTKFALMHDKDKDTNNIRWLQSLDDPVFAMPVMDPLYVKPGFNPVVQEESIKEILPLEDEDLLILVTVTVPQDITKMTVNLKGPIIINSGNCKACQIIIDDDDYPVKYPIYDYLQQQKEAAQK